MGNAVTLQKQNGETVSLDVPALQHWFALVESTRQASQTQQTLALSESARKSMDAQAPQLATRFVSRFGMQNPKDVLVFLNSPAGDATKRLIGEEIAELVFQQEEQQFQAREEALLRARRLAYLLMGLAYGHDAEAKALNRLIQEDIDKTLAEQQSEAAEHHQETPETEYQYAIDELNTQLDTTLSAAETLEKEAQVLSSLEKQITERYVEYLGGIEQVEREFLAIPKEASVHHLEDRMAQIRKEYESFSDSIARLIENGQADKARLLLQENIMQNLQFGLMHDLLAVSKGEKVMYNTEGEETQSLEEAVLILKQSKKVVKDADGNLYLLKRDQDLTALNDEEKLQAREAFERARVELLPVKHFVKRHQKLEEAYCQSQRSELTRRSELLQKDITSLLNQITTLQSARAGLSTTDIKPSAPQPTNTPTLSRPKDASALKPSPSLSQKVVSPTRVYRDLLVLIKAGNTSLSEDVFGRLKEVSKALPLSDTELQLLNGIKPGTPIPPATMTALLQTIERFGVNAGKPNVAPEPRLKGPFSMRPDPDPQAR